MKEYIEKILHRDVQITPYEDLGRLPLAYRNGYDVKILTIGSQKALLAAPVERVPLAVLRKQYRQMEIYTGFPCVLYMSDMNYYTRDVMLNEGIPFVWEPQFYRFDKPVQGGFPLMIELFARTEYIPKRHQHADSDLY